MSEKSKNRISSVVSLVVMVAVFLVSLQVLRKKRHYKALSETLQNNFSQNLTVGSREFHLAGIDINPLLIVHPVIPLKNCLEDTRLIDEKRPYTGIFFYSDISCDTCRDEIIKILKVIERTDQKILSVRAVLHSSNKVWMKKFIRMNQVMFPVFYDEKGGLIKTLGNGVRLIFLLVDRSGYTVNAFVPNSTLSYRNAQLKEFLFRLISN